MQTKQNHSQFQLKIPTLLTLLGIALAHFTMNAESDNKQTKTELATLAGGCFWCTEAVYESVDGVVSVVSGYIGGHVENPTYQKVTTGSTGHAEAIQIEFDPSKVSYSELLDLFWQAHDPTTLNRQGADVGPMYRSGIFYHSDEQMKIAKASKVAAQAQFTKDIVTEITEASTFWKAEGYHQDYFKNNRNQPYCRVVISPKLKKLGIE
jgi:peptide-methionine (S)-S-oxide reductase